MKFKNISLILMLTLLTTVTYADNNKIDLDPNSPDNYNTSTSNTSSDITSTSTVTTASSTTGTTTSQSTNLTTTDDTNNQYDTDGNKITGKQSTGKKEKLTSGQIKSQQLDAKAIARSNQIIEPIRKQVTNDINTVKAASDSPLFTTPDSVRLPDGYTYPAYYQGNSNLPLIGGYRGSARFLDKSSVTVMQNDSNAFTFAENIYVVDMNATTQHDSTYTQWFRMTKENGLYVWRSSTDNINWSPMNLIMDNPPASVKNLTEAFLQGYQIATGSTYKEH